MLVNSLYYYRYIDSVANLYPLSRNSEYISERSCGIISEDLANVVETLGSIMLALATDNKDLVANSKKLFK